MSSGKIENQILDAVQTIVDSAIANAGFDRTIQAQIAKCANEEKGKYAVKYQDGVFYAYSSNVDITYSKGDNVYVLIPKNDMSETKTILGLVENLGADYISTVEEADKYETVGQDCVSEQISIGLCSYVSSQEIDLYNVNSTPTTLEGFTFDLEAFEFYLKKSNCFRGGADFRTVLPESQHYDGNFGICYELVFGDNAAGAERTISYKIDIDKMEGDPYFLSVATHQYGIWNIDSNNFIRLKRIYVFQNNFPNQASGKPNDIFITNVDLMGVNPVQTDETSNCSLSMVTPQGIYFDDNDLSSSTRLVSTVVRAKGKVIPEDSSLLKYYWFKENNTVGYNSILFQRYGGPGWECLNNYNTIAEGVREWLPGNCSYTVQKNQVPAKENSYKCVVVYNEKTILTKEFIIYNNSSVYNIILSSSGSTQFYYDIGETTLTCLINGAEQTGSGYTYNWSLVDNIGEFSKIEGTTNKITVSARTINNYAIYKCIVSYGGNKIGKAEITLRNSLEGESAYVALVTNGNQVFKYNENGVSPASEAVENPITVLPLDFKLYDDMGTEVTQTAIGNSNVEWWVPTSNTMISVLSSYGNPIRTEDGYDVYSNTYTIGFEIAKTYNPNYTNNGIILKIKYKDKKITSRTNFNFLKEGQSGSNGTDFVCRIVPNATEGSTIPKNIILIHNDAGASNNYTLNFIPQDVNAWLNVELYHNGIRIFNGHADGESTEDISSKTVTVRWSILANKYKYDESVTPAVTYEDNSNLTINSTTGVIIFSETEYTHPANIVKCVLTYNDVEYIAAIPIILVRASSSDYKVSLKDNTGFLNAMYTTDGKNPIYNNINPFELIVENDEEEITELSTLTYDWTIRGQVYLSNWQPESNLIIRNISSPHKIYYLTSDTIYQSGKIYYRLESEIYTLLAEGTDYSIGGTIGSNIYEMRLVNNIKYIKPADNFDGMCVSNGIYCSIKNSGIEIADIHIPVYLYLNRYGHAAINGWDGNTISLNDNAGIILSPQVGAGKKNATDNTFTGVLMGSVKESGSTEVETGLFGYNAGQRTIKLDAETGSAEFGTEDSGKIIIAPNEGTAGHAYLRSGNYEITYTRVYSGNTYTNSDLYFSKTNDVYTELKKDVDYTVGATITANNIYKLSTGGAGLEIDLTDPHIRFGSGNFRVDADGRVFATEYATANIKLNTSSVTGLNTTLSTINEDVGDLKNSINYFEVVLPTNTVTIATDSNRIPTTSETKSLECVLTYKGATIDFDNLTVSFSPTSYTGITTSSQVASGVLRLYFAVRSDTALQNSTNNFDVTFAYTPTGGTAVSVTKRVSVVSLEKGKDGTSVTIKGNYTNLAALCAAKPSGNTLGDGYILDDNSVTSSGSGESGHLFVFTNGAGTQGAGVLDWKDVGKFKGENGRSIESVAYWYLSTTSYTQPTGTESGWTTNMSSQLPTSSKKYLWQKETITYLESDGSETTQTTILLLTVYGDKGETGTAGTDGVDAKSVDISPSSQFFKSPTGEDGVFYPDEIFLYPRFQYTTYDHWEYSTDGTTWTTVISGTHGLTIGTFSSVANSLKVSKDSDLYSNSSTVLSFKCVALDSYYKTVSISKVYDVVELDIGGRNFISGSEDEKNITIVGSAGSITTDYILEESIKKLDSTADKFTFTISCDAKSTVEGAILKAYTLTSSGIATMSETPALGTLGTTWKRYSVTKDLSSGFIPENLTTIRFKIESSSDNTITLRHLQLETGNKATSWTLTPEEITTAISNAAIAASTADSKADKAQSKADDAYSNAGKAQSKADNAYNRVGTLETTVTSNHDTSIKSVYQEYYKTKYSYTKKTANSIYEPATVYYTATTSDSITTYTKTRPLTTTQAETDPDTGKEELVTRISSDAFVKNTLTAPAEGVAVATAQTVKPIWEDGFGIYQRTVIELQNGNKTYLNWALMDEYQTIDDRRYTDANSILSAMRGSNTIFYNKDGFYCYDGANELDSNYAIVLNHGGILFRKKVNGNWQESSVWTIDGKFDAKDIDVTNLHAESITDGILTLGNASADGELQIVDDTSAKKMEFSSQRAIYYLNDGGYVIIGKDTGFQVLDGEKDIRYGDPLTWIAHSSGTYENNINYYTEENNLLSLIPESSITAGTTISDTVYTVSRGAGLSVKEEKITDSLTFGEWIQTININATDGSGILHKGLAFIAKQ